MQLFGKLLHLQIEYENIKTVILFDLSTYKIFFQISHYIYWHVVNIRFYYFFTCFLIESTCSPCLIDFESNIDLRWWLCNNYLFMIYFFLYWNSKSELIYEKFRTLCQDRVFVGNTWTLEICYDCPRNKLRITDILNFHRSRDVN